MIDWLMEGDPVIQYMVKRDLLNECDELNDIQKTMLEEGWVHTYLSKIQPNGHWGRGFYQPKWTSSHYTLLDLALFNAPRHPSILNAIHKILDEEIGADGGANPSKQISQSDVCINGMLLNYACYFGIAEERLKSIVDFIISQRMNDGGFNCRLNRSGAKHSSVHTTICAIEGIERYRQEGYTYRINELIALQRSSEEFLLSHRLFKSDRTGEIIHKSMTVFSYPWRWKYNVLRAMTYFRWAERPYDPRMKDAIDLIESKCKKGLWPVQAKHPGEQHMILEPSRSMSRMNTLLATLVLEAYKKANELA